MAITPAGFQNHIQNPLAAVMYAIMNGAFDNAADARRTDSEMRRERRAERDAAVSRAFQVAGSTGVVPQGMDDPTVRAAADGHRRSSLLRQAMDAAAAGTFDDGSPSALNLLQVDPGAYHDARARSQAAVRRQGDDSQERRLRVDLMGERLRGERQDNAWNSPVMRGVRGVGDAVANIIKGGVAAAGRQGRERPQIVDNNGSPHEVVTMPDGTTALRRLTTAPAPTTSVVPTGGRPATGAGVYPDARWKAAKIDMDGYNQWAALHRDDPAAFIKSMLELRATNPDRYALIRERLEAGGP